MADAFARMAAVEEQRLTVERERVALEERRLLQDQVSSVLKCLLYCAFEREVHLVLQDFLHIVILFCFFPCLFFKSKI